MESRRDEGETPRRAKREISEASGEEACVPTPRPLAPPVAGMEREAVTLLASPRVDQKAPTRLAGLPPLDPLEVIARKRALYCGPTDESNWAIPGRLMVGAFPGVPDDEENERVLASILKEGVTTFVCLQREYDPRATDDEWRSGAALRPYFSTAVDVAHELDPTRQLSFVHFGIEDCSVGDDGAVTQFAIDLADRIRSTNEIVYLHCWGGHGRAGTIVCLLLHLLYGLDDRAALVRCQLVHDTRRVPIAVGSPQTPRQREQVSRIIAQLRRSPRATPHKIAKPKLTPNQVSFDENDDALRRQPHVVTPLPHLAAKHLDSPIVVAVASPDDDREPEPPAKKPVPRVPQRAAKLAPAAGKPSPRHHRLQQRQTNN
mmetsp:Transcript_12804/g.40615  ORF Transcript_12804/g.40615 Transcript_12804/m.40615 type:complete len:374 (-) Transcript_12804:525-1646(-)